MTKKERDIREVERRVERTNLGGIGLMVSQKKLQTGFWIAAAGYLAFFYFTARPPSFEALLAALGMVVVAFVPAFLWCTGRAKGLPILPIFALTFIPAYALPVQTSSRVLKAYSAEQQAEGLLIATLYLGLITLIWHQICNRSTQPRRFTYAIDPNRSTIWLLGFMAAYLFYLTFVQEMLGERVGLKALLAGIFRNASAVAVFVFSYQLGKKELKPWVTGSFLILLAGLTVVESASLILIGGIARLALALGGYALGGGKIPWKAVSVLVPLIWVLHAGKAQMREEYWKEGGMGTTQAELTDYPTLFARWVEVGLQKTFRPTKYDEGSTAAERGVLLDVFLKVRSMTPSQKPFLEGATYEEIPKMLVPRFVSKDKSQSHIGNVILAYVYEFTSLEGLMRVSIQFDLMIEAYANYGYAGVLGVGLLMGTLLGVAAAMAGGVPLFSFRFLFGILLLNTFLGAYNTAGVFVTTLWQGTIGLAGLSLLMMRKMPNPLYVQAIGVPAKHAGLVESGRGQVERPKIEERGMVQGSRIEDSGVRDSLDPQSSILNPEATAPGKHERPKRFVYGTKGKK